MSDIKRLSEVIAFSMGDKKKTPEDVATLCMCAAGLVNAWLAGTAVPDRQRWGFLCSRLDRSLFTYGSLHSAALAELAGRPVVPQSSPSVGSGLLASKLKEALAEVELEPDMRAIRAERTSTALKALPSGWRSRESINKREAFARNFFRSRPHADITACEKALAAEFGVGTASQTLSRIRDEERAAHVERTTRESQAKTPTVEAPKPDPVYRDVSDEPLSTEAQVRPVPTVDDQLQVAIDIVLEAMPHLAEMTISRSPSGEVSYKVVEAKVVETTGRMVRPR